jgi:predicted phosphodiesterase
MLAILSDIHGNLSALEAVIADAKKNGCNEFISLGDVAGYYSQPGECINILKELGAKNILGNHDSYITLNQNCPRSKFVTEIINFQKSILTDNQVRWLKESKKSHAEKGALFLHGGPNNHTDEYLYTIREDIIPEGYRWLFSGHTHVQSYTDFGQRGYCNPGSVGQPRDGDPRSAYAILSQSKIYLKRVEYDIDKTAEAMKKAGFEPFSYENLYKGSQIGGRIDSVRIIRDQ